LTLLISVPAAIRLAEVQRRVNDFTFRKHVLPHGCSGLSGRIGHRRAKRRLIVERFEQRVSSSRTKGLVRPTVGRRPHPIDRRRPGDCRGNERPG